MAKRPDNMVESAINYGQLQYFVYCNLLTGMINIAFWTYYENAAFGIVIMLLYFSWMTLMLN